MNFFREQELARKRLKAFKVLFYFTVSGTALLTTFILFYLPGIFPQLQRTPWNEGQFYLTKPFWLIFLSTFFFIRAMSWIKRLMIGAGGEAIAQMAGAAPLPQHLNDIRHKRLRNIVEEMSIAAGILPPKIYVMDKEPFINAFAAGFTMHDAVLAVSEGCLNKLTRDELQGVVAHEIGHIVNGDMKLNLELIGYLFGLTGIHQIGRTLMFTRGRNRRGHPLMIAGFLLFVIGFFGHLLGVLLKQRISRGQEFAADARAVQFTRNPEGIGGALKKILSTIHSFEIKAQNAQEMNHLFLFFPEKSQLFSTHPPLVDRLKKIFPNFKASEFSMREEKKLRNSMETDLSPLINSSFVTESNISYEVSDVKARAIEVFEELALNKPHSSDAFLSEIDVILSRLRTLDSEETLELLRHLKEIILADGSVLHRELLCFVLFRETLLTNSPHSKRQLGLLRARPAIINLLSFLAQVSASSPSEQKERFTQGLIKLHLNQTIPMRTNLNSSEIISALETTRRLVPKAQASLLKACMEIMRENSSEKLHQNLFIKVLCQVMNLPTSAGQDALLFKVS